MNLILLGIFSGIAVATSLFLAAYFFFIKKKNTFAYRILGTIFVAIALRVIKSIVFFILDYMVTIGLGLAYLSLTLIGPLLYIYVRSTVYNLKTFRKEDIVHLIVPIVGTSVCVFGTMDTVVLLFRITTLLLAIYVLASFLIHKGASYTSLSVKKWNIRLIFTIGIICLSFAYQHLTQSILNYAIGSGIASFAIYYIFFYALKSPVVFSSSKEKALSGELLSKVRNAFENDKIYRLSGITTNKLSETLDIPPYLVTKCVKHLFQRSFPESINHFRIEEIKSKLADTENHSVKIEELAYEVGFNTPSIFYTKFKKATGLSPKKYRDSLFN